MHLITKLQEIGLTKRETEVYLAMLQKKEFAAPEIAKLTTISRTKVYEVLQNLINKGLCNDIYKNGKKVYRVIDPGIVIKNVISNQEQELLKRKKIFSELEKELSIIYKNSANRFDPLEYIEILNDIGQIREKWFTLQGNLKKEILIFTKPPYAVSHNENVCEEVTVLKKKIKARSIYEFSDIMHSEEDNIKIISNLVSAGEEARIIEELPMKMAIFDEKIAMFTLNDPVSLNSGITSVVVNHLSFAKALKHMFENVWEKATPFYEFKANIKLKNKEK